jgi:hypothetical protein
MALDQSASPEREDLDKFRGVPELFSRVRLVTRLLSFALAGIYTWLQIQHLPYTEIVNESDPAIVLQLALIVMYFCWVFGFTMDFNTEAMVFVSDPNRGKVPLLFYLSSLALFVAAIVLLWTRKDHKLFAAALTIFSIVCLFALLTGRKRLREIVDESRKTYIFHRDWLGKEQLDIVEYYLVGKWVWIRQATLLALLVGVDVMCWISEISNYIAGSLHEWNPEVKSEAIVRLVPLAAIIVFLAAAEGSQWYMRLRTRLSISALRLLKEKDYRVERTVS